MSTLNGNGGGFSKMGRTNTANRISRNNSVSSIPRSTATPNIPRQKKSFSMLYGLPPPAKSRRPVSPSLSTGPSRQRQLAGCDSSSTATTATTATTRPKRRYVVATMAHCGSIYEEMTRQLLATGRWQHISVKQRPLVKTLVTSDTQKDISDMNVHLLLGDKPSCERVIATRRSLAKRIQHGEVPPMAGSSRVRIPMGNGSDGEERVIDFVENTRCITLKSSMVATLLQYHQFDWHVLGQYVPRTFKIMPGRPSGDDERRWLLETAKDCRPGHSAPLWIAKSSSGCHGDDIEIFSGDRAGLHKLLYYVDGQREGNPWVVQQYIDRPLLYHRRKFDIRCMVLLLRDTYSVYVHEELVMRTSSAVYNKDTATSRNMENRLAHITNHCIQVNSKNYSAYEEGNELWREHLDGLIRYRGERLLQGKDRSTPYAASNLNNENSINNESMSHLKAPVTLRNTILPQMDRIIVDSVLAARPHIPLEPQPVATHCFQILGYDFLIDDTLKVWLLEINGAPAGPERLVPKIMEDTIDLAINPYFPCSLESRPTSRNGYRLVHP